MSALPRTAIFTKRPRPGRVKTRLCPPLSPRQAAFLAAAMLADTVAACGRSRAFETTLRYAPAADGAWFRARFPALADQAPQRGPDLGARLAAHFTAEDALRPGRGSVVVGSDAPLLRPAAAERAHARLAGGAELVLVPDDGGGYALVGLRGAHPELFTAVEMSTADMLARTLAVAAELGLAVELLEPVPDVDTPADLERLAEVLAADPGRAPDTARALVTLGRAVRTEAR